MFRRLMKKDKFPVLIILMMTGMWLLLDLYLGKSFYGPSPFNSYTLQALSWLQGRAWVENNPALELAIYEGKYYVSFPPLPSVMCPPVLSAPRPATRMCPHFPSSPHRTPVRTLR